MPSGGYLYKRGDIWWGRIRLASREHKRSLRTTSKKEAAHRLKGWRQTLEREVVGAPDCPTIKAATIRWAKEVLAKSVKPSVRTRYLTSIGQIVDAIGDKPVDTITAATITEYASRRALTTTNATIRRDITALSRLLASCVAWGHRQDNPARFYDRSLLRERRDPIRPPEPRDVDTVIAAAPPAMAKILRLLDQTGMRANEAVMLEVEDVKFTRRQIELTITKTNRPRTIPFATPGGDAGVALLDVPKHGALFPSGTGKAYQNFPTHAAKVIANVAAREMKAKRPFRRFRVHDLRHGFAIRALREGMDIYRLSRHLGHTSVKTTEIYLAHLTGDEQGSVRFAQVGDQRDIDLAVPD
jgi:integrase/recombinase XerD